MLVESMDHSCQRADGVGFGVSLIGHNQQSLDRSLPDELPDAVGALHRRVHVHDAPVLQGNITALIAECDLGDRRARAAAKSASLFDPDGVIGLLGLALMRGFAFQ